MRFFLFLHSLFTQILTYVGGALTMTPYAEKWLEEPWKKRKRIQTFLRHHVKDLKWIGIFCVLIAVFQAWSVQFDETQTALYGKDGKSEAWGKYNACSTSLSVKGALLEQANAQILTQGTQLSGQQDTFNKCILALGLRPTPPPLKMTAKWVGTGIRGEENGASFYIVVIVSETNQLVSNVNLDLKCNHPFAFRFATIPTDSVWTSSSGQGNDDRSARIILNTPWFPGTPLVVSAMTDPEKNSDTLRTCELTQHR